MEKKSFKKLFLRQIFLLTLLILGSTAFTADSSSEEEFENIKVLITAKAGLQFIKEDSPVGRKIIYDCELGLKNSGFIEIFDVIHPLDMTSLVIRNCHNLTVEVSSRSGQEWVELEELKISNVTSLKLVRHYGLYRPLDFSKDVKVLIRNVQHLVISNFFYAISTPSLSVKLQNVVIDKLYDPFPCYGNKNDKVLHLKNVKVKEIEGGAFCSKENISFTLTLEDSHFEDVHSKAFDFEGQVKITNNTFGFLDEGAFSINSSSPVIFSGNHVKSLLNPFYIRAFEVNIINNTFDSITTSWLSKMITPRITSLRVLNITGNLINHWSHEIFYLDSLNFPDIIIFEGNYLNCTCKNALTVANTFHNYVTEVFLNKRRNNFCQNFGNCPLHKIIKQGYRICSGTFRCPEDENEDDEDTCKGASHLKSILSVLKNIDKKLDQIVSKYNSEVTDEPN